MKNWTQRFAVYAVFGILIAATVLAGCGSNQTTAPVDQGNAAAAGTKGEGITDSAGKPINPK